LHEHAYHLPSRSSQSLEFPRTVRWERDYWLNRCLGYRVEAADGTLGHVESLRFQTRHDLPDVLVVRSGFLRKRRCDVRVDDVVEIDPVACRILLMAAT
jgi:hypothetical protein